LQENHTVNECKKSFISKGFRAFFLLQPKRSLFTKCAETRKKVYGPAKRPP